VASVNWTMSGRAALTAGFPTPVFLALALFTLAFLTTAFFAPAFLALAFFALEFLTRVFFTAVFFTPDLPTPDVPPLATGFLRGRRLGRSATRLWRVFAAIDPSRPASVTPASVTPNSIPSGDKICPEGNQTCP